MIIGIFGSEVCRGMCNVRGGSMVFIKKFIYFGTSMFVGVTGLKEMVFASGMSDGILCNVIHWKMDMFYLFS
jgi:hypothetical protein